MDGAALKARYQGILFSACAHDANGSIFPLAFGIGDTENDDSWEWFFTKLREVIGFREELAIVADRHKSIIKAVTTVYPEADFGICVQHLARNLKNKFPKGFNKSIKTYFTVASRSYLVTEFHRQMGFIQNCNNLIAKYLIDADPRKWSRAYFNGRRYGIMTSNIAESMNNVDKKARLMSVGFLVEWLRGLMQRWFVDRREKAKDNKSILAPQAEEKLRQMFHAGVPLIVSLHVTTYKLICSSVIDVLCAGMLTASFSRAASCSR